MKTIIGCLVGLAIGGSALAQNDVIRWTDGTMTKDVTVTGFTLHEVSFKTRNNVETRSADRVADLDVEKVKDKFKRAFAAPRSERVDTFLSVADELKSEPFLSQFGYYEAAQMLLDNQDYSDAFQILDELEKNCPDSGYKPLRFRAKLDYYLENGQTADFAALAAKYETATQVEAYPKGFKLEATYYRVLARGIAGELSNEQLRTEMQQIVREADPNYPVTANRAKTRIADALRLEGKLQEAKQEFEEIVDGSKTPPSALPAAWLGLAHVYAAMGTPANKEPYRDALLAFLRVYLDDNAPDGLKAEALFYGAQAASKWGGESSSFYNRVLRARLLNHYPDSSWAEK
ncbi:MAG: hypothetical protein KDB80_04615 [Planctomycetes bacterium]|nr:hypothetical protein [Planctomycetota bacterium]